MERSQEIPVKPANENTILEIRDRDTHTSCFCVFRHIRSSFPSLALIHASLDAVLSSLSGICRGKKGLTHERDCFAFGHVVHVSTGKFSGLDPDGTCGSVGSQLCFVSSIWGWTFPCQCRVSTAKVQPLFLVDSRPGGLKWWSTNRGS